MKGGKKFAGMATVLMISLFVLGCGDGKASSPAPEAAPKEAGVSRTPVEWRSDGSISDNEYTSHQKTGDIDVYSRVSGDTVMFGLKASTKGYLAIGFGAEDKMKGADILMCYVKDGKAVVTEVHSTGPYGPHPAVQATSVNQVSGSQKDGVTIIEFSRKLMPEGPDGKALKIGDNQMIWSVGSGTDIEQKHSQRGYGTVTLVQ